MPVSMTALIFYFLIDSTSNVLVLILPIFLLLAFSLPITKMIYLSIFILLFMAFLSICSIYIAAFITPVRFHILVVFVPTFGSRLSTLFYPLAFIPLLYLPMVLLNPLTWFSEVIRAANFELTIFISLLLIFFSILIFKATVTKYNSLYRKRSISLH
jgi:ABC-type polysaccharide/polyol phosphate export permease